MDFLYDNFTKKFVNQDLKQHRRQQLYERELALLPATQPLVEQRILQRQRQAKIRELNEDLREARIDHLMVEDECLDYYRRIRQIRTEIRNMEDRLYDPHVPLTWAEKQEIYKHRRELKAEQKEVQKTLKDTLEPTQQIIDKIRFDIFKLRDMAYDVDNADVKPEEERRQFVRACPGDGCRGFLSTQWKCGLCQIKVCSDCHEIKKTGEEHVCKPENVETAKLIAKDSKPCPTCGAISIKISGCNQIFCIGCQTAWNWNTGKIDKGPIHAQDYYTFMERIRGAPMRQHGDVPCGGMPTIWEFTASMRGKKLNAYILCGYDMMAFQRLLLHMYEVDGWRMRPDMNNDNAELRIKYLMKEIDENGFKRALQIKEKATMKKRENYQVISTLFDVAAEAYRAMQAAPNVKEIKRIIDELKALVEFSREAVSKIAIKYDCVPYYIPELVPAPK